MARATEILFTEDQVVRLTGLSRRQLRYWEKTRFFAPTFSAGSGGFFSFRDVVGLRTIATLRKKVPLQELRKVGAWLKRYGDEPWSRLRFYLAGRKVYVRVPGEPHPVSARGQSATEYAMQEIARETRARVEESRQRPSDTIGQIDSRKRPVIRGTRVSTEAVWTLAKEGASEGAIREAFPHLTGEDVRAALEYERKRRADTAAA